LKSHQLTHNNVRNFLCGICKKTFKRKCDLKQHKLTHRNVKDLNVVSEN